MNEDTRYRLQRKTQVVRPNILGGHSFPVYAWQWRDIAACAEREPLEKEMARLKTVWPEDELRVEDTRPQEETQ